MIAPLGQLPDPASFGGKASALCLALRAGLRVPEGLALSAEAAQAVERGEPEATEALLAAAEGLGPRLAVRSSALDEDGAQASLAGQHRTLLGVPSAGLVEAVAAVVRSARAPGALAYRRRLGLGPARMGVVVQRLVDAVAAGVAFTIDPVTGADEVVVEATWGLGEAVVAGLVTPDHWRLDRQGRLRQHREGSRDLWVRPGPEGGSVEPLPEDRAGRACLERPALDALFDLLRALDGLWPGPHDVEFAWDGQVVWLLQRRPVTGRLSGSGSVPKH